MLWSKEQMDVIAKAAVKAGCSIAEAEQAAGRAIAEELERERLQEQQKRDAEAKTAEARQVCAELASFRQRRLAVFGSAALGADEQGRPRHGEILPRTLTAEEAAQFDQLSIDIAKAERRLAELEQ